MGDGLWCAWFCRPVQDVLLCGKQKLTLPKEMTKCEIQYFHSKPKREDGKLRCFTDIRYWVNSVPCIYELSRQLNGIQHSSFADERITQSTNPGDRPRYYL